MGSLVNAMLFSTGIAPLITDLMIRYPHPEAVGFNLEGILIALAVGFVIGFFLPAGLANSPKVHTEGKERTARTAAGFIHPVKERQYLSGLWRMATLSNRFCGP